MSNEAPTDALRMVPTDEMIRVGAWRAKLHREANPGDTWEETAREVFTVMSAAAPASPLPGGLPPISLDGPNEIDFHRQWLARQLLDSKLDDDEAYSIVRHDPAIKLPAAPTGEPK